MIVAKCQSLILQMFFPQIRSTEHSNDGPVHNRRPLVDVTCFKVGPGRDSILTLPFLMIVSV